MPSIIELNLRSLTPSGCFLFVNGRCVLCNEAQWVLLQDDPGLADANFVI